jgi:hypothetical protein
LAYAPPSASSAHAARLHEAITQTFADYANAMIDNSSEFKGHFLLENKSLTGVLQHKTAPHLSTKPNLKKAASLTKLPVTPIDFLFKTHPQSSVYWTNTQSTA